MSDYYKDWYENFMKSMDMFGTNEQFNAFYSLLLASRNTFSFNRKIMEKAIDISWVEAIENGLPHIDTVLRNPRKTIEDVEEIVPIALSRKITVDSVKHLGQHTDLIQSVDPKTGKITPSKILNVHKEETLMTYENKFVNTLIDRLFIFISRRYEKLTLVSRDEEVYTLSYEGLADDSVGNKMNISIKVESVESLETINDSGLTVWERVEKIKKAIEGYKGSVLCTTLGNTFIRPPVMRTNAIMKNVDLKACLVLWQYIESYDKTGYEINVQNTAQKPPESYIDDMYKLAVLNFMLMRSYTRNTEEFVGLKTKKSRTLAPKIVRRFEKETSDRYDVVSGGAAADVSGGEKALPANYEEISREIDLVIEIEKEYLRIEAEKKLEAEKAAEEAERRRIEEEKARLERERIEREMEEERERIRLRKEEEERKLQEMLERERAEQEAREKAEREERERLEREEQERIAEQKRLEEEERLRREEEERRIAEQKHIEHEKVVIRNNLGAAVDGYVDKAEPDETEVMLPETAETEEISEFESSEVVARRAKEEQQRREAQRRESERAERLKIQRKKLESKSFSEIRREYSKNPYHIVRRGIRDLFAYRFGIISKTTDNPDLMKKLELQKIEKAEKDREREIERELEVLFEKYCPQFRYRIKRDIEFRRFKRKKRRADKGKPRPEYKPVVRTAEEQQAIDRQMNELYKKYHVSFIEKIKRRFKKNETLPSKDTA